MELQNILRELRRKINRAQNFLQCECGVSHAITRVPDCKPINARYCRKCAAKHQARNHDIWAETRFFGLFCNYYACLNGVVYDITQWADCSANKLKHMKANSHMVQYRLHNICTTTEYIGSESPAHQRNGSKKQRSGSERQCCAGCGSIRQPSTPAGEPVAGDPFSSAFAEDGTNMTGPFISVSTNAVAAGGDAESSAKKAGRRRRVR
ncbi:DnaJ domain-containing protein [Aphelenchoides avenae]|nr:DnaJ domain-containing protein [Aphelenchus avenae]